MNQLNSFLVFNLKSILKDRITLVWTLIFPILLIIINFSIYQNSVKTIEDKEILLVQFWSFMTIMVLLNGIAVEIANIREVGALKSYVMLAGSKYPFILAILVSQILILSISITVITILFTILFKLFSLKILLYAFIYILLIVPISFIFLVVTSLPFKASSIATISTILSIALFYIVNMQLFGLEWINPLHFLYKLGELIVLGFNHFSMMIPIIYVLYVVIGFYALIKLDINSKIIR
ncbi:hypothetical protein RM648_00325 [Mammaliicoccus sciuri]|uniref:hypothetical protein n=1 Tax=Mammaliicoccus sciuri TaxID=1296 RepID=UPI000BBE6CD8|nr:hypothetical protein [Mammaliicoccus sciuri]MDT0702967.1 hypothetical protein [Mammaliicoccus sciuri]MDT0743694.1 hypothetical protein [Mammaliicoccus sciuri]MDT0751334.1 hypothetical protein [Mammaliicoccus sciuri]MEB7782043.1 hypothetical protein [Mammaliicoccus sciuri]PCM42158.1 hypothetical protein CPU09_03235 [Mammaliicoccus sciuri]